VNHLDKDEARTSWSSLAAVLQRYGLDGTVAWLLDALGPLTVLGAQLLHFGEPFLRSSRSSTSLDEIMNLLEEPGESRAFAAYLREKG
jgi:hypothetical protein